jgi:plasmid segregation protein ParM
LYKIAVDLGYGFTKGVNQDGKKIIIPSIVGPGRDRTMADILGGNVEELDNLYVLINGEEYYVGKLAEEESLGASRTLDADKIKHPNTRVLLATAAALLLRGECRENIHLITGLPYADFALQRQELKEYIKSFQANVKFYGGPLKDQSRKIKFNDVTIFPQAAGAIYTLLDNSMAKAIARSGKMISVVDIGYKTTDFVTFQGSESFKTRTDLSDTLNVGMNEMHRLITHAFKKKTGKRIDPMMVDELINNKVISFGGREIDFSAEIDMAYRAIARSIMDSVRQIWGDMSDFIEVVFITGGGAIALKKHLHQLHHHLQVAPDAQFANARGFLAVAEAAERKRLERRTS